MGEWARRRRRILFVAGLEGVILTATAATHKPRIEDEDDDEYEDELLAPNR